MKLGEKQELFSKLLGMLILRMYERGYRVRMGDAYALPRQPLEHLKDSQHYVKCAADLNLFKDGVWLKETRNHKEFGDYWESLHPLCRWGGAWNDGNHYELRP